MLTRKLTLPQNKSFFLFGPRNTGKSTLIRETYKESLFIDLLDPIMEDKFLRSPKELKYIVDALPEKTQHIVIDEVQKVPALLDVVHQLIESTGKYFVLTGSSARKIKKGGANLLAGRAYVYYMFPFTFDELGGRFDLQKALQFGLLPKIYHYNNNEDCQDFLRAYTHTYLKEEIWAEHFIKKLDPFRQFLEVAAQMNGKIINYHKIALDVGVDDKTIKQYFEILEDTLIGVFLPGFQHSVRKRLLSKPKFYFFDTGVKRALCRQITLPVEQSTYQFGELFEQFIILECIKRNAYNKKDYQFSYYMTKDGVEIDLVVERPGKPLLFIEIKSKKDVSLRDLRELLSLQSHLDAEFVCFSNDEYPKMIEGVKVLPWQQGIVNFFDD